MGVGVVSGLFLLSTCTLVCESCCTFVGTPQVGSGKLGASYMVNFYGALGRVLAGRGPARVTITFSRNGAFHRRTFPTCGTRQRRAPRSVGLSMPVVGGVLRTCRVPVLRISNFRTSSVVNAITLGTNRVNVRACVLAPSGSCTRLMESGIFVFQPHRNNNCRGLNITRVRRGCDVASPLRIVSLLTLVNSSTSGFPKYPNIKRGATVGLVGRFKDMRKLVRGDTRIGNGLHRGMRNTVRSVGVSGFLTAVEASMPMRLGVRSLGLRRPSGTGLSRVFASLRFGSFTGHILGGPRGIRAGTAKRLSLFNTRRSSKRRRRRGADFRAVGAIIRACGLVRARRSTRGLCSCLVASRVLDLSARAASASAVSTRLIKLDFTMGRGRTFCMTVPTGHRRTLGFMGVFGPLCRGPRVLGMKRGVGCSCRILVGCKIRVRKGVFSAVVTRCLVRPRLCRGVSCLTRMCLGCRAIRVRRLVNPGKGGRGSVHSLSPTRICRCTTRSTSVALHLGGMLRPGLGRVRYRSLF